MAQANGTSMEKAIEDLITSYHELNTESVDELTEAPSPLEFMRYVAKNTPFVIRGGTSHLPAMSWNVKRLKERMEGATVEVAVTPYGNADAAAVNPEDGLTYFATPLKQDELFNEFLDYVIAQELGTSRSDCVKYAQTQNDNLRNEFSELYDDVEKDIPWARIALRQTPDAINFWLGNSKSVTALHRDNYQNIYCQIIGTKHFLLLPPVEAPCVNERSLPCASYKEVLLAGSQPTLQLVPDSPRHDIPSAIWDPDVPEEHQTPYSRLSRPLRVSVRAGDVLYLPALWYHKVSQSCSDEGICCSVNYWYDMDFSGSFYVTDAFLRTLSSRSASTVS